MENNADYIELNGLKLTPNQIKMLKSWKLDDEQNSVPKMNADIIGNAILFLTANTYDIPKEYNKEKLEILTDLSLIREETLNLLK